MTASHTREAGMNDKYDALIIGGGLAGVTVARELQFRGIRPLIIEARDRLGGRMWVTECGGGPIEMGGQNVFWTRPYLWTEIGRYGLEIAEAPSHGGFGIVTDDGLQRLERTEALGHLAEGFEAFFDRIGTAVGRPDDPLSDRERLAELERLDGMSVKDRFDELEISPEAQRFLKPWLTVRCGGAMEKGSLAWMIHRYASAGGSWRNMLQMAGRFQLAGGSKALIDAIYGDSKADVRFESPVAEIADDGEAVHVTTVAGETFTAPVAVIGTSANVWPHIEFSSGISDVRREAGEEGMQTPYALNKLWAVARGEVEEIYVQRPDPTPENPIIHVRTEKTRADGTTMILGCSFEPSFDLSDKEGIARMFAEMLPMPNAEIVDVIGHNWVADEYARGGTSMLHPGQLTGVLTDLREPEGRLVFATADIAYGIPAGMDGAIEAGVHGAGQAARIFNEASRPQLAGAR
jgi:nicotine oxidoreductase